LMNPRNTRTKREREKERERGGERERERKREREREREREKEIPKDGEARELVDAWLFFFGDRMAVSGRPERPDRSRSPDQPAVGKQKLSIFIAFFSKNLAMTEPKAEHSDPTAAKSIQSGMDGVPVGQLDIIGRGPHLFSPLRPKKQDSVCPMAPNGLNHHCGAGIGLSVA
jgi:hypothetical protein